MNAPTLLDVFLDSRGARSARNHFVGEVVIANVHIQKFGMSAPGDPMIRASGFSKVSLYDVDMPRYPAVEDPRIRIPGVEVHTSVPFLLMQECLVECYGPGTKQCNGFANNGVEAVRAPGTTVVLLDSIVRGCISAEFTTWRTGRNSPITDWLRKLAADLAEETGGRVGAVGMCFTGGFALGMMVDDVVGAPVLSQPSLPFAVFPWQRSDLGVDAPTLERIKERCASGTCVLGLRYSMDPMVPVVPPVPVVP